MAAVPKRPPTTKRSDAAAKQDPVTVTMLVPSAGADFSRSPGDVFEMQRAEAARCLVMGFVSVDDDALRKELETEGEPFRLLRAAQNVGGSA